MRKTPLLIAAAGLLVLAGAATAVVGLTLGDRDGKGVAQTDTLSSASPAHPDPNGKKACDMLEEAKQYNAWGDHSLVANVVAAARESTNMGIASSAAQLRVRLAIASAAVGQRDQPDADRNLRANMEELERQCIRAELTTS